MINKLLVLALFCAPLTAMMDGKQFAVSGDNVLNADKVGFVAKLYLTVRGVQTASARLNNGPFQSEPGVHGFCRCGTYAAVSWTELTDTKWGKNIIAVYRIPDAIVQKELIPYARFSTRQQRVTAGFYVEKAGCEFSVEECDDEGGVSSQFVRVPLSCQCALPASDK